jgi:hemoglobin/transferrin/lactoferrin receptor protein
VLSWFFATALLSGFIPQECFISVAVSDQQGYSLTDATVIVQSANATRAAANPQRPGEYCFAKLDAGTYDISVSVPGFERQSRTVDVREGASLKFELEVAHVSNGVTVTAMRGDGRDESEFPQATTIVTREDIMRRPSRILPDILREEAGIHVQQTTAGQGTPFIRGLMGNRILVMLDGVRFNQSTFRLGPIQYMATIDPASVERVEIVRGPGSVLYGSDAMGGVINIIRKDRYFTPEVQNHGRFLTQFGSADLSSSVHGETVLTGPRFVISASGSFQKFNNLRAGGGRYSHAAEARFVTNNPEGSRGRQAPTGFEQYGADASLRLKISSDQEVSFVYQRFEEFDVPRFDQIAGGNGNLRYQFDPQRREMFYADYQKTRLAALDSLRINVSYQSQPETRRIQNLSSGRPGDMVRDWSDTDTLGFMAQALARAGKSHTLTFGAEAYLDSIESAIETTNLQTNLTTTSRGRFPRDSRYRSYGAFVQDDFQVFERLHFVFGGRLSAFRAMAPDVGIPGQFAVPSTLDYAKSDLTGSAGIVWTAAKPLTLAFNVGRAFRAPNINDFGGTGLTGVRFEIPAPALKPESLVSYEFSTKLDLKRAYASVSVYDSEIHDLIDRVPGSINGQTMIGNAAVLERTNFGRARILGFESSANVRFSEILLWGNMSHVSGRNISSGDYLSFEGGMPPTQGWLGVKWEPAGKRYWFETYGQAAAKQDRISGIPLSMGGRFNGSSPSADALDARMGAYRTQAQIVSYRQYHGIPLTAGTLPNGDRIVPVSEIANTLMYRQIDGFVTLNARGGLKLSERNSLTVLLENILDRNYRTVGSGVDAPGVNLRIGYEHRF